MAVAIYRRGGSVVDIQEEDGDMDLMTEHTTDTSGPLHTYNTFGSTQGRGELESCSKESLTVNHI